MKKLGDKVTRYCENCKNVRIFEVSEISEYGEVLCICEKCKNNMQI